LAVGPTVVRANASEVLGLAGLGEGGRGVDARDQAEAALPAAQDLLSSGVGAVAVSGAIDMIVADGRCVRLSGGSALMTKVTGVGCALGALVAAACAVTDDPLLAAVTSTAGLCAAAELAEAAARGPGSFAVHLLDELARLDGDRLASHVRLSNGQAQARERPWLG
jgi:hydroxyethylthiazole kinase